MDQVPDAVGDVHVAVIGPANAPTRQHVQGSFLPILGAIFSMDRAGRVEQVTFDGPWTGWERWHKTYELVNAHPEWNEAQAVQALMKAGAKYGPDQKRALLTKIPTRALGQVLGVDLSLQSLEFRAFRGKHVGSFADLDWTATFKGRADGKVITYVASFEPFGGRLTFLSKVPL